MVHQFTFEHTPEALHRSIVVAIPLITHGSPHPKLLKQFAVVLATVLAASIRMMENSFARPLHGYCTA